MDNDHLPFVALPPKQIHPDGNMQNAQLKPEYNVQIGVESEYIVAPDIFQDSNDVWIQVS